MLKKYLIRPVVIILLLGFSVGVFFFSGALEKERKSFWGKEVREVRIGENIFQVEIAATPAKRNQGLFGRKELCRDCAMLFLFSEKGLYPFWMKEMNFDLDIIWIDKNEIAHIAKNVSRKKELEIIRPDCEADKVLEINAGLADKLGIKTGDKIEF
ncbi:MAG: hypothetical protein CO140_01320 [Candidatus Moranbacteria bacterium CG_4_9_14_3_um_filter_40_7]|nr:MAG: hypothetical protein COX31_00570 [Candidatus Moranbacteria bacterium CG23_combo_of_CG06-09_8_20_14_all_40_16]PIU80409.1 MAG: hypothetical protein COS71_03920 [Candidatus Moranbacteria bacterium CG06_land_8_20_14_3_00_40_12]PJA87980.1 MAG: hypothetical protein CO140_01320 [Candidatus Moranbacteria bacterium CG_4_9_14_3_um_filter_40_7]